MICCYGAEGTKESKKVNLKIVPFRANKYLFHAKIRCVEVQSRESDVYCVPMDKGVRVSIASSEAKKCRKLQLSGTLQKLIAQSGKLLKVNIIFRLPMY